MPRVPDWLELRARVGVNPLTDSITVEYRRFDFSASFRKKKKRYSALHRCTRISKMNGIHVIVYDAKVTKRVSLRLGYRRGINLRDGTNRKGNAG